MSDIPPNKSTSAADDLGLDPKDKRLWAALEGRARQELWASVSDARLVILQGLSRSGHADALTAEESDLLLARKDELDKAERDHAFLATAIEQVASDAALFDEAWDAHFQVGRPAARRSSGSRVKWPARVGLGLSAMVLVAVAYFSVADEARRVTLSASEHTQMVQLADGSTVRLAPGATLSFVDGRPFVDGWAWGGSRTFDRSVELSGNAYFDVQPGSAGFTVRTANAATTVLGTRFGVSGSPASTEVVLISGRVAVAPLGDRQQVVILEPGQQTSVRTGSLPTEPVAVNVAVALPWLDLLIFKDTPMSAVAERLLEVRGITVTLGPGISELAVTGTFTPEQPTAEILQILASTLGVTLQEVNGAYTLALPGVLLP